MNSIGFRPLGIQALENKSCNSYYSNIYIYMCVCVCVCTERFIMCSLITNIYNKKTKGPTLMKLFIAKEYIFFYN
jgi:hypothetical protein